MSLGCLTSQAWKIRVCRSNGLQWRTGNLAPFFSFLPLELSVLLSTASTKPLLSSFRFLYPSMQSLMTKNNLMGRAAPTQVIWHLRDYSHQWKWQHSMPGPAKEHDVFPAPGVNPFRSRVEVLLDLSWCLTCKQWCARATFSQLLASLPNSEFSDIMFTA